MGFTTVSEVKNHSAKTKSQNGHSTQEKRLRNEDSKEKDETRVFVHRNSIITDMLEVNHLQTLYNMCHVLCFFLFIATLLLYLADRSKMWEDLDILKWNFSKFPEFLMFWLLFNLFFFAFYEGFKLWISARNKYQSKIVDKIFALLFAVSWLVTFIVTGYYMYKAELRFLWGVAAGSEQARIHMKIYSFVRECAPRVLQYTPEKDGNQEHSLYPTRKHYTYFLFAPTLLYRDSYPRTEKTQWNAVFKNLRDFFLCILLLYCTMFRCCGLFKNAGIRPFTQKEKVLAMTVTGFQGIVTILLMGFGILHCWQNIFAELLRFGDREFYSDWWNATSAGQHFRRWNTIVRDWFHAYLYKELQKREYSEDVCRIWVFLISCVFHDYCLSLGLRFFYPIFAILYAIGGVGGIPWTRGKTGPFWNAFMWAIYVCMVSPCTYHYILEWYVRKNCPNQGGDFDFFIPRMLDPSCQISDYPLPKFFSVF